MSRFVNRVFCIRIYSTQVHNRSYLGYTTENVYTNCIQCYWTVIAFASRVMGPVALFYADFTFIYDSMSMSHDFVLIVVVGVHS